jgi:DNA-directed RNA polymerase II subunit RPB2
METANVTSWKALDAYLRRPYALVRHHLDSYDDFLTHKIPETVASMPMQMVKEDVQVGVFVGGLDGLRVYVEPPMHADGTPVLPIQARVLGKTYASTLYADIVVETSVGSRLLGRAEYPRVRIGAVPIMLHSKGCVLRDCDADRLRALGECPWDQGGYFIVDGQEKVLVSQERTAFNKLFVVEDGGADGFSHVATIRSIERRADDERKVSLFPKSLQLLINRPDRADGKSNAIGVKVTRIYATIPLFVLFRALGVESDKEILKLIVSDLDAPESKPMLELLRPSVLEAGARNIYTQARAVEHLASSTDYQSAERVKYYLVEDVLPNAGRLLADKAIFLGMLVRKLLYVRLGSAPPDNRDDYVHKRLQVGGTLMADLFRDYYFRFRKELLKRLDREYYYGTWKATRAYGSIVSAANIAMLADASIVANGLIKSLKGQWNVDNTASSAQEKDASEQFKQEGVAQELSRTSYFGYASHVRRLDVQLSMLKIVSPHRLYGSQYGMICPMESPDGAHIGLVKHLALTCEITGRIEDPLAIVRHLADVGLAARVDRTRSVQATRIAKLFLDQKLEATSERPAELVRYLRALRRAGYLHPHVSVAWNVFENEIDVSTDEGRFCRPLFIVAKDTKTNTDTTRTKDWSSYTAGVDGAGHEALRVRDVEREARRYRTFDGWFAALEKESRVRVEYVDVAETANILIAPGLESLRASAKKPPAYTHCEIHPCTMLSIVMNAVPFIHHNHAPYVVYSAQRIKQGISLYATNFRSRTDVIAYVLQSPQKPIVTTTFESSYLCDGKLAYGENVIVAVACFGGYNQEDSVILNRSSLERGMFGTLAIKTVQDQEDTSSDDGQLLFANPIKLLKDGVDVGGIARAVYSKLDDDGFPKVGSVLLEDDVLIGKISAVFDGKTRTITNRSVSVDKAYVGMTVDRVIVLQTPTGRVCKICLKSARVPELGDKFSSRYSQKGVVGMVFRQEEMPFSGTTGVVPDVVINPCAFPKRMTVSHVLEALVGKACCLRGGAALANAFEAFDTDAAADALEAHGFQRWGDEILSNPRTGEQMPTTVFVGVNYYMRQTQMVKDKINYRDTGPVNKLTRQPTKGKGRHGGLRIGEMEWNALASHGAASFIKEAFMDRSDGYTTMLDAATGDAPLYNLEEGRVEAETHRPDTTGRDFRAIQVPYSFKLFRQELQSMSIDVKLFPEEEPGKEKDQEIDQEKDQESFDIDAVEDDDVEGEED